MRADKSLADKYLERRGAERETFARRYVELYEKLQETSNRTRYLPQPKGLFKKRCPLCGTGLLNTKLSKEYRYSRYYKYYECPRDGCGYAKLIYPAFD